MAQLKRAWLRPLGMPRLMIRPRYFRSIARSFFPRVNRFFSERSFRKQRMAEMNWAITVARATPATPMLSTKAISSTMLITEVSSRKPSALKESPSPRSTPARML